MYPKPTSLSTCLASSTIQSKIRQLWHISSLGALYFATGMSLGRCPDHLRRQRYFSEWSESISLGEKTSGSSGSISVRPGVTLDTGRPWSGHLAYCAVAHYNCKLGTPCSTLRRTPRTHYNCTLLDTPEAHSLCRRLHKCTLQNDTF